eukprot:750113-Hanusia_phi.AAC.2
MAMPLVAPSMILTDFGDERIMSLSYNKQASCSFQKETPSFSCDRFKALLDVCNFDGLLENELDIAADLTSCMNSPKLRHIHPDENNNALDSCYEVNPWSSDVVCPSPPEKFVRSARKKSRAERAASTGRESVGMTAWRLARNRAIGSGLTE